MTISGSRCIAPRTLGIMLVCLLLSASAVFASPQRSASGTVVSASSAGAHLDSDLLKGGGTDDTVALQAVLDRAVDGAPLQLVIDGPALISGLNVYGNTTLECLNGAGLYLKDGASRAIVRNAHRSRDAVTDERITVRGCFLNGNRKNQSSADTLRPDMPEDFQRAFPGPSNKESDGTYMAGLEFLGVNDLTLEHVTLWNVRAFGALIANGERITIRDVTVNHGGGPNAAFEEYGNTDGLHFKGPLRYVSIEGVRIRVGDDALAFNADDYETDDLARRNDFGPYIRSGPITDVTVNDVQLMETQVGIRVLSAKQRIDRIAVTNVTGVVREYVIEISHFMNPTSLGNVGSILFGNINVDRTAPAARVESEASRKQEKALRTAHPQWFGLMEQEFNYGLSPFCNINGHVEHLLLGNVMTRVADNRPILRLGRDAEVQLLTAELHLFDPTLQSMPVKLDAGARVHRLNLLVDWQGRAVGGKRRNPITSLGTIGELRRLNGPLK